MAKSVRRSNRRRSSKRRGLPPALKEWNQKVMALYKKHNGSKSLKDCMVELKKSKSKKRV